MPETTTTAGERLAEIRQRQAVLAGRDWSPTAHSHASKGCRCLSCYDDPTGWVVDHPGALDCEDRVGSDTNDFGRDRESCDSGPLLTYEEADALAHAAEDIRYLLERVAVLLATDPAAVAAPGSCGHRSSEGHLCGVAAGHLGYHRNVRLDGFEWTSWVGEAPVMQPATPTP